MFWTCATTWTVILDGFYSLRHSSSEGCQNFRSALKEGPGNLGNLERAGSILSMERMVKEDMELEVENSVKGQSPAREGKCKERSGSRGWEGLPLESLGQGSWVSTYKTGHSVQKQVLKTKAVPRHLG